MCSLTRDRSNMKLFIVLVGIIAAAQAFGDWKGGMKVRFGVNVFQIGSSYFMDVPRTVSEAKSARWVETVRPNGPMPSLVMYCPSQDDRILCGMYDDTNYIAGTQVALPMDEYEDAVLDWETLGFTQWSPPVTTTGVVRTYWTQQQYFVNEATLERDPADRIRERNLDKTLQEEAVWVTGFNGERLAISTDAEKIADTANSGFTQQACVVLMGRHYYYNMTATTPCTSNGLLPWFPLVHSGELIGMGFIAFGNLDENKLVKDYFERPDRAAVEMIVPEGPTCLYEMAEKGLVTMHSYFIDAPWLINCIGQ